MPGVRLLDGRRRRLPTAQQLTRAVELAPRAENRDRALTNQVLGAPRPTRGARVSLPDRHVLTRLAAGRFAGWIPILLLPRRSPGRISAPATIRSIDHKSLTLLELSGAQGRN